MGKQQDAGQAEKDYEGKNLGDVDCVFQAVKDMLKKDYKDDGCFVQFYLNYMLEGNREQNKLMFLTWLVKKGFEFRAPTLAGHNSGTKGFSKH